MVADRKVFLKSLLMITVTCFIARCLEISPVLPPSAFCLFTGGKWPKEEVQEREKAEGLEDAGAESELTGSTKGGPGQRQDARLPVLALPFPACRFILKCEHLPKPPGFKLLSLSKHSLCAGLNSQQLSTMGQTEHPGRHSPSTEFKALCSSCSPSCGHLSLAESQKLVTVCWRTTKLIVQGGYFTLSIPRILKGTMGGTLVMECRYNVGEEGHRKFWCRGPNWTDCVRVIETEQMAGQEVRRGRVTLRDNPREHLFHVITEDLEEGDADTYWCGVDRATSVPQAPVAVTIFPGSATVSMMTTEALASMGTPALTSHMASPGLPAWQNPARKKGPNLLMVEQNSRIWPPFPSLSPQEGFKLGSV
ncbi:CMRF35-like molecule 1 isoform X3 [Panthera leo]|uniref:CMRF35-like molecule 1 isoform X3 n=1 Tax=Panthera leo TaxID=9689 RepID=UPI001C69D66B|nr:CMRF35-like molecule 1 isoform X3 [Panthera leo]